MSSSTVLITLTPTPGFCIKTLALQPALVRLAPPSTSTSTSTSASASSSAGGTLDVPTPHTLTIPKGAKVFVNIAYAPGVPPPPPGSEDAIARAVAGDEPLPADESGAVAWFVPVVVSEPREDRDKAGRFAVVFDCVYNDGLKARARDAAFKTFLIELAFQRIEEQAGVPLSRQIGTPNIAFKGTPAPRAVRVPVALAPPGSAKKLVEELPAGEGGKKGTKGILKSTKTAEEERAPTEGVLPELEWTREAGEVRVVLKVPRLTHAQLAHTTLDLEARRVLLHSPVYALDLDLDRPDAELRSTFGEGARGERVLALKRVRDLDVDCAKAEWRVGEGVLVIHA